MNNDKILFCHNINKVFLLSRPLKKTNKKTITSCYFSQSNTLFIFTYGALFNPVLCQHDGKERKLGGEGGGGGVKGCGLLTLSSHDPRHRLLFRKIRSDSESE